MKALDREIARLALPAVAATVTTPLLGLMDVAFTGHMGGPAYLAAIAIGGNIFNLLYWLFSFLRSGTGGITAQARGAIDPSAMSEALFRSLLVSGGVGALIIVLQWPIESLFGWFMEPDPKTWGLACRYFHILVWGAPAVLASYTFTGWMVGMGSSKSALWMSLTINVVNIVASFIFVIGMHMRVEGVAVGTLIAQWSGVAVAIPLARRLAPKGYRPTLSRLMLRDSMKRFFSVNLDIFLRTVCLIAVTLWFTRRGAAQGPVVLAANALLMQFFIFFSYFTDGLAYAAEAIVGRAVGAGDHALRHNAVKRIMLWGAGVATAFTVIYGFGGWEFIKLLTTDYGVRSVAADFLPWVIAIPFVSFAAFIWDGIFIGYLATRSLLYSMLWASIAYFITLWILEPHLHNHALWIAFLVYLAVRSLLLTRANAKFHPPHPAQ